MADGSITLDTKINTEGIEGSAQDIQSSLNRIVSLLEGMAKSVDGIFSKLSSGATSAAKATGELREEIEETVKAQEEWKAQDMSDLPIHRWDEKSTGSEYDGPLHQPVTLDTGVERETEKAAEEASKAMNKAERDANEYKSRIKELQSELKALEKSGQYLGDADYDKAYLELEKLKQAVSDYKKELVSPATNANPFGLDTLAGKVREAELTLKRLENAGKGLGDADYDKAYSKLVALTAEAKEYKKNLAVTAVLGQSNQELEEQNKKLSIAKNLVDKIKTAFSGISKNLSNGAIKDSGKSMADGFGNALKTLLKYSFGIRSLFVLTNKFRTATVEGFKNLAQYSDVTNNSISMLVSSLTRLKNSLSTAFNPILTVIAPSLTMLINLISKAITYVGMFFAALTGQKTFAKAIAVQEDYAKSLQKTSSNTKQAAKDTKDAAKEAKSYLSSLDEIDRYTSDKNSNSTSGNDQGLDGGYTASSPSEMFETVPIENQFKELADKIKKIFAEIFTPFQEAWEKEGRNTINSAKRALSGLGTLAKSVGKSLVEVWTNGTGTTILTTMLRIAQNVLDTIGNIATGFAKAWEKNSVGTQIIQNIANALVVVLQFIEKIAEDTAKWAENLDFYPLLESISNLTSTFAPIIEAIGNVLEWIYNNIVLPMLKWVIETGLPTAINLVSDLLGFFAEHQSIIEAFGAALVGAFAAVKIGEAVTTIMGFITTLAEGIGGFITLMTGSGGILGGLSAIATAIGPGGLVIAAIAAVIAAGVLLYKNWDTIKEVAGTIASAVSGFFKEMGEGVSRILSDLKETFVGIWDAISTLTSKVWSGIVGFVTSKTREMYEAATRKIRDMCDKVSGFWGSAKEKTESTWKAITSFVSEKAAAIRDAIVDKFKAARDTVVDTFEGIRDTIRNILNKVIDIANGAIGTVNSAIGGIESALSFGPWEVPTPWGKKTIGFSASFPRVPTIPYLAKGAVIPPKSEFLAVLGDQKQGRNLEAPEGLIREIIEDALAKNQETGGNTRLTVMLNRRVLFDEFIKEAKMRRDSSGLNPFELA